MTTKTRKRSTRRELTPEEQAKRQEERAAVVTRLRETLDEQLRELTTSSGWRRMLASAARMHRYSFRNLLLIMVQAEKRGFTATTVAGYKAWQQRGRQIRAGEKGLQIFSPVTYLVPATVHDRADASVTVVETEDGPKKKVLSFRPAHVWDIAQTGAVVDEDTPAEPTPAPVDADTVASVRARLAAQITAAGYRLTYAPLDSDTLARTVYDRREVVVQPDLSAAVALEALAHELAHIQLGHEHRRDDPRSLREVEAESVAYIVLGAAGVDISTRAVPYVAGWADGDVDAVTAAAENVTRVAHQILDDGDQVEEAA